jgi:hypothetical protein
MPDNQSQEPMQEQDYPEAPGPDMEEVMLGAMVEMMEDAGVKPLGRASSPSESNSPEKVIPPWYHRLSEYI